MNEEEARRQHWRSAREIVCNGKYTKCDWCGESFVWLKPYIKFKLEGKELSLHEECNDAVAFSGRLSEIKFNKLNKRGELPFGGKGQKATTLAEAFYDDSEETRAKILLLSEREKKVVFESFRLAKSITLGSRHNVICSWCGKSILRNESSCHWTGKWLDEKPVAIHSHNNCQTEIVTLIEKDQ